MFVLKAVIQNSTALHMCKGGNVEDDPSVLALW
jgi:hypothetical protein